jgi:hypothetical protein
MPRSEKFYTFFLVGLMSLVVLVSVVAGIRSLKGDVEPRPTYEKAPPAAFRAPPDGGIVDMANTSNRPIEDAAFLRLHKSTRVLAPLVLERGPAEAESVVFNNQIIKDAKEGLSEFSGILKGQSSSLQGDIYIARPASRVCDLKEAVCRQACPASEADSKIRICERSQTSAIVRFVQSGGDGEFGSPTAVKVIFEWVQNKEDWEVVAINASLVSLGGIDDTVEESQEEETDPFPGESEEDSGIQGSEEGITEEDILGDPSQTPGL